MAPPISSMVWLSQQLILADLLSRGMKQASMAAVGQ